MTRMRRTILLCGACCSSTLRGSRALSFAPVVPRSNKRRSASAALHSYRNSPGFVGFRGDDDGGFGGGYREPGQGGIYDMRGQVSSRPSNLSRRDSSSVAHEDRNAFDYSSRYSQMPHPSTMMAPHIQQQSRGGFDGRIQGGSRHTYGNAPGGRTFVETDGRPLDVEVEVWDGPNNTPTKVRMYSEDGRARPMNIVTNYDGGYGRGGGGGTMSVRNVGSLEFPMRAGVSSYGPGGGSMVGDYGGPMGMGMGGGPMSMGLASSPYDSAPVPSTARGETVQGGSLKTFTLPSHVNAAQVTITSDGLPVNAKVELWGTATHVKQLAEVYNDNGQTRPFAAIIDVPGGENTVAVRNTGPLEYPIRVVVEPVSMGGMGGGRMGGRMGGGYGGYGDERMMMMEDGFGRMGGPPLGGPYLPPPPPF